VSTNIVCLTHPEPALSQTSLSIRFGIIQQSGAYKCNAEQKAAEMHCKKQQSL